MVVYGYLCFESLRLIQELCDAFHVTSYIELSQLGLGPIGMVVASICMFLFNWYTVIELFCG